MRRWFRRMSSCTDVAPIRSVANGAGVRQVGVDLQLAESAPDGDMTVECEALVGEEEHEMLEEVVRDLRHVLWRDRVEIDAANFGAECC